MSRLGLTLPTQAFSNRGAPPEWSVVLGPAHPKECPAREKDPPQIPPGARHVYFTGRAAKKAGIPVLTDASHLRL